MQQQCSMLLSNLSSCHKMALHQNQHRSLSVVQYSQRRVTELVHIGHCLCLVPTAHSIAMTSQTDHCVQQKGERQYLHCHWQCHWQRRSHWAVPRHSVLELHLAGLSVHWPALHFQIICCKTLPGMAMVSFSTATQRCNCRPCSQMRHTAHLAVTPHSHLQRLEQRSSTLMCCGWSSTCCTSH